MADFYNRATGQFLLSHNSSVFCHPRTPQMRNILDGEGNPTGQQEMEPDDEATGPVPMKTGTAQVGRTEMNIADLMMNPDVSEIWATSRDNLDKGVPLPYWKPADDGSNKVVEMTDAEKVVVDTARDIAQGKTEFNGVHYAFVDQQRIDLIAAHAVRNENSATFPMTIKSSDGKTISIPDIGNIETLFNAVFGL